MRIKTQYSRPTINTIEIDYTISNVMASLPPVDPTDPNPFNKTASEKNKTGIFNSEESIENNPFGGTSPNY